MIIYKGLWLPRIPDVIFADILRVVTLKNVCMRTLQGAFRNLKFIPKMQSTVSLRKQTCLSKYGREEMREKFSETGSVSKILCLFFV